MEIRTDKCLKVVTGTQMAAIDRETIEGGILGEVLMERAGKGVAEAVLNDVLKGRKDVRVVVLCGKGNNGGDGFVVARILSQKGVDVRVFLLGARSTIRGDAALNLRKAEEVGLSIIEVEDDAGIDVIRQEVSGTGCLVDALFGTGIKGGLTGLPAEIIEVVNAAEKPIVAVDLPSGIDADTGRADGAAIRANLTVTFGLTKVGHWFYPGRAKRGELRVIDTGFPPEVVEKHLSEMFVTTGEAVREWLPVRPPDTHKGECGRVVVIAGSIGLTGAATLTAGAAARIGAGLVTLGTPESLNDILEVKLTEVMTRPLPEVRKRRCLSLRAVGEIRRLLQKTDCLAVGPGLATYRETTELVRRIVGEVTVPTVIDADGLNALGEQPELLKHVDVPVVLTPHAGEFSRLTGLSVETILSDPIDTAGDFAKEFGVSVVLKGAPTVIADPSGKRFINPTGNAGMATGGMGDVLTGVIAGLIGQGMAPLEASVAGVYLHGLAGDLAINRIGGLGLLAGELIGELPGAIREIKMKSVN
ncbi:MAG: NAD(P)H-hydrate dehydratase [Candidatus Latescibacteria bacterium]|nr:NAD(P)H-hydrate dehydratase [Candidatus Latescibacterota bacterium]